MKRLYKSRTDRKISGVCGGIAEYLNFDSAIIRLIWVLVSVFSAGTIGVVAYIVCAVVLPDAPAGGPTDYYDQTGHGNGPPV